MQKIISQQDNLYEFEKQIKSSNLKKYSERESQTSESKTKILNSLKLKKKVSLKTSNNPTLEVKKNQEKGKDIFNSSSKHRKFNKFIRSTQHSQETISKIGNDFQPKTIKDLVSQQLKMKNLLEVQFEGKLINTQKKSHQELKNMIENLQINHFKQIKMLENIIFELIGNSNRENLPSFNLKSNNSQTTADEIIRLKNQISILKKRYIETIESNIKLIQKFNDLENKFKKQVDTLQIEIKKLNKKITESPQNTDKERPLIKSNKKYSADITQDSTQKQKINLGHIFTFKKFDLSQKVPKSKIMQTDPENQISCLKSNVNGNPQHETYYQYYNQKIRSKIIKTEQTSSSSIRIKLKHKLSFQNEIDDDIKRSTLDEHFTQSSQDFSELDLESVQSKI